MGGVNSIDKNIFQIPFLGTFLSNSSENKKLADVHSSQINRLLLNNGVRGLPY